MHQRSFPSSILDRLRRHLLKYPTSTSIRASIVVVRPTRARPARPEPTAHPWQRRQPSPSIELPILTPLVRPGSMPIAHAAPPHLPSSRFPPLEVFVRRPPVCATPSARGRHPKTFTLSDIASTARDAQYISRVQRRWQDKCGHAQYDRVRQWPRPTATTWPVNMIV